MHALPANDTHVGFHWPMLLLFVVIMFGAGALGGFVTFPEIAGWYARLAKPEWTPPNGIFGPVWNTIFVLTAIATWMVWRRLGAVSYWIVPFGAQWVLNVAWSVCFFRLHSPGAALVVIALLWFTLAVLIRTFWKVRPVAGALLLPYIAWVSYAAFLNAAIWRLN